MEGDQGWMHALSEVTRSMSNVQQTLAESVGAVSSSMTRTTELLGTVNALMEHHLVHGVVIDVQRRSAAEAARAGFQVIDRSSAESPSVADFVVGVLVRNRGRLPLPSPVVISASVSDPRWSVVRMDEVRKKRALGTSASGEKSTADVGSEEPAVKRTRGSEGDASSSTTTTTTTTTTATMRAVATDRGAELVVEASDDPALGQREVRCTVMSSINPGDTVQQWLQLRLGVGDGSLVLPSTLIIRVLFTSPGSKRPLTVTEMHHLTALDQFSFVGVTSIAAADVEGLEHIASLISSGSMIRRQCRVPSTIGIPVGSAVIMSMLSHVLVLQVVCDTGDGEHLRVRLLSDAPADIVASVADQLRAIIEAEDSEL